MDPAAFWTEWALCAPRPATPSTLPHPSEVCLALRQEGLQSIESYSSGFRIRVSHGPRSRCVGRRLPSEASGRRAAAPPGPPHKE